MGPQHASEGSPTHVAASLRLQLEMVGGRRKSVEECTDNGSARTQGQARGCEEDVAMAIYMCSNVGCGRLGEPGTCEHCRSRMRAMKEPQNATDACLHSPPGELRPCSVGCGCWCDACEQVRRTRS